jgi:hypothetical protein
MTKKSFCWKSQYGNDLQLVNNKSELEICLNIHPGTVDIFVISEFLAFRLKWPGKSASVVHYCFLNKNVNILFCCFSRLWWIPVAGEKT